MRTAISESIIDIAVEIWPSAMIVAALKRATDTIPIVFSVVSDPIGEGFVASLARPGGNITGFTFVDFPLIGKWLEMLKEIAPGVKRVALVFNPQTAPFYPLLSARIRSGRGMLRVGRLQVSAIQKLGRDY